MGRADTVAQIESCEALEYTVMIQKNISIIIMK